MTRVLTALALTTLIAPAWAVDLQDQQIWSRNSGDIWKSSQDGTDYGTAWRQLGFDDSSWLDEPFLHYTTHGDVPPDDRGFYFRTTFELTDLYQVQSMQWEFYYDDAAVLFLNGNEVYRTIRNNLPVDPELPIHVNIPWGGYEDYYVQIPGTNTCETGCGTVQVPAVPISELVEGTNVVGIMVWTRSFSDIGADVSLTITRDLDAPPPAPTVDPVSDQTSQLADSVSLQIEASTENSPPLGYSATGLPAGLSIGAGSGLITGAPAALGPSSVVVTVTDDVGSTDVAFSWQIDNALPVVTNPGPQQSPVLNPVLVPLTASDPDGGALSFAATGLPAGISIHPMNGGMSGTPTVEGPNSVTVTVTDNEGDPVQISFPWQIAIPPITIDDPGTQVTAYGAPVSLMLTASDPMGTVVLSVSGLPAGLSFDTATGTVSGMPTAVGDSTVLVDGSGPSGDAVISFEWMVPNELPVVTVPGGTSVGLESFPVTPVVVSAVDPDGGIPTLAVSGLPPGLVFDSATGEISGVATGSGLFAIDVTATDDEDAPRTESFDWNISPSVEKVIVINEIVASNDLGLLDEDGDTSDWIELYNPTPIAFDLQGWVIQDLASQWTLPSVVLPPGGYQIVFASGKDRAVSGAELHTNFRLSRLVDRVLLTDPNGFVVDDLGGTTGWQQQVTDVSFGVANPGGELGYLETPTPDGLNSDLASGLVPEMSAFSDRLYNVGETVALSVGLFDPDGDAITFDIVPAVPGVDFDQLGVITGVVDTVGSFPVRFELSDTDGDQAMQDVEFIVYPAPAQPARLVLNEFNAVPPVLELLGGMDPAFVDPLGNGGDWYEFVVIEQGLDLGGWTIELWDRDTPDGLLSFSTALTFENAPELSDLPAGTLITISEDWPDELSLDPANGDYHINLQSNDWLEGSFITPASQQNFNSSRSDQNVVIYDPQGAIAAPLAGETEAWDLVNGGVGAGEVLSLCVDPSPVHVDPTLDYWDDGFNSTWGTPNTCTDIGDPLDLLDDVEVTQDFSGIRDLDDDGLVDRDDLCPDDPGNDPDGDGVCAADDVCSLGDDAVDGDADGVPDACDLCPFDNPNDSDADTVCDSDDICDGSDDTIDTDGDGIPNGCDSCLSLDDTDGDGVVDDCDPCPLDPLDDSDGDGSCDATDTCMGEDDRIDTDIDGIPDGCDPCPMDPDDTDGDGVCDSQDLCPGGDDTLDTDADAVPDACDVCPLDPADDSDGDGSCDGDDLCPGEDDTADADGDGAPDACDPCPDDAADICDDPDTDPPVDTDLPDDTDTDVSDCVGEDCEPAKRCGCSSVGPARSAVVVLLGLVVFGRRR